jgi:hypothetical protein
MSNKKGGDAKYFSSKVKGEIKELQQVRVSFAGWCIYECYLSYISICMCVCGPVHRSSTH